MTSPIPTQCGSHTYPSPDIHTPPHYMYMYIPNDDDLIDGSWHLLHLRYEYRSHCLVKGSAVHVDGCSDWEHEPSDTWVSVKLLLQTLNGHWEGGRAVVRNRVYTHTCTCNNVHTFYRDGWFIDVPLYMLNLASGFEPEVCQANIGWCTRVFNWLPITQQLCVYRSCALVDKSTPVRIRMLWRSTSVRMCSTGGYNMVKGHHPTGSTTGSKSFGCIIEVTSISNHGCPQ